MKCKFCDEEMESKYITQINKKFDYCHNHKTVKVVYKSTIRGDIWTIRYNDYALVYANNQTFLKKCIPKQNRVIIMSQLKNLILNYKFFQKNSQLNLKQY